jgi:glycerol-3-phosphate dehydrogenase subunit B
MIDLLGVHPVSSGRQWSDPWAAIERLRAEEPQHPYARLSPGDIRSAMQTFTDFLSAAGQLYFSKWTTNIEVVTPAGTVKTTFAVPHTMRDGVALLAEKRPCLLVDFKGLKGYSARQIALGLAHRWPALRTTRLIFPDFSGELYTERLARSLDLKEARLRLAQAIQPHLGSAAGVGLPAVLGLYRTEQVLTDLTEALGVPVFEIPTMLPSVAGLRLREAFERHLPDLGGRSFSQQRVVSAARSGDGWIFQVGESSPEMEITAKAAILCSGRFLGKGLHAERNGISETIFNLPVVQPASRTDWHEKDLLHHSGHAINRAGLAVDDTFRPLDGSGKPPYASLFAAGSILAYQDWIRQKCGSGLAIATAWGAVSACTGYLKP